jgi:hypothetical protein
MEAEGRKQKRRRLGEMLAQQGVITVNQLKEALKVQSQFGGRIGSVLVGIGYMPVEALVEFLGRQLNIPAVNLYTATLDPSVLNALPFNKIKEYEALPFAVGDRSVTLAMADPGNLAAMSDLEFGNRKTVLCRCLHRRHETAPPEDGRRERVGPAPRSRGPSFPAECSRSESRAFNKVCRRDSRTCP